MKNKKNKILWFLLSVFLITGSVGIKCFAAEAGAEGEETQTIPIQFDYNYPESSEENKENTKIPSNGTITMPEPAEVDGYAFLGWKGKQGEDLFEAGQAYSVTAVLGTPSDTTNVVQAHWCQTLRYSVDRVFQKDLLCTEEIKAPYIEKDGYKIVRWELNEKVFGNDNYIKGSETNNGITTISVGTAYGISSANPNVSFVSYWEPSDGSYLVKIKNNTGKSLNIGGMVIDKEGVSDPVKINSFPAYTDDSKKYRITATLKEKVSGAADGDEYVTYDGIGNVKCITIALEPEDIQRSVILVYLDIASAKDSTVFTTNSTPGLIPEEGSAAGYKRYEFKDEDEDKTFGSIAQLFLNEFAIKASRPDTAYRFGGWRYYMQAGDEYPVRIDEKEKLKDRQDCARILCVPVFYGTVCYDVNYPSYTSLDVMAENPVDMEGEEDRTIALDGTIASTEEYRFLGWTDGETVYPGGGTYPVTKDTVTLKGEWEPVSYPLIWKIDGDVYREEQVDFGAEIAEPEIPAKEGYSFSGWTHEKGTAVPDRMPAEETVMEGSWEKKSYRVSYDGNGSVMGIPSEVQTVPYEDTFTVAEMKPALAGHIFKGWSDGAHIYQPGEQVLMGAADMVLTARWEKKKYTVNYDGAGAGTGVPGRQEAEFASSVTAGNGPEKDGYTFIGWEQISTGSVIDAGGSFIMPDMDETLKAKWKIAWTRISGKGSYYLIQNYSYDLDGVQKVSGDSSEYVSGIRFYVPENGIYTFE